MIKNRKTLVLLVILLIFAIGLTGCSSSSGSKKYIVTITTKVIDNTTGKVVQTATTKTASGKQGSTSGGITKFTLDGNKEYTFISSAPYYVTNKKRVRIGKENIVITIKLSQEEGKILGRVTDEGGSGLKGATVSLVELNKKTETNSDGTFKFIEVPITGATYTLEVNKSGYGKRTLANLEIPTGENKKDVGKIVLSNNPGILSGKITDPTGSALNGVNVSIVELGRTKTTDYSGNFEFEVLPGTYSLEFTNSDYQKVTREETVQSDKTTFVSIEMTPKPGQISGIVLDNYGVPINDVQVSILGANKQTKTLSNGHFLLEDVPPGNYTLEFIHPQFQIYNVTADVKRAQETNLGNIMLQEKTGMLTGRVLEDSTGNPIANVNVEIQETGVSTSTNSNGYYTFNNLRIGTYKLQISAVNYSTEEVSNVVVKENSVTSLNDVRLIKDPATILGNVKDSLTGASLENVTVTVNETGDSFKTNTTGSFKIENLKSATYSLTLTFANYYSKTISSIYCGPDSTTNLGTIQLDPKPVKITGVTTPGATIEIQETGDSVTVDSTGSFVFTGLNPGTYTINITKSNYRSKTKSLETKPGQTYDLGDLTLSPLPGSIVGSSNADTITIKETGQTLSNTASTFKFDNLQPGDYTLEFTRPNYQTKSINITVDPNQITDIGTVTLDPIPSTIKGYVDSSLTDVEIKLIETAEIKTLANGGYFVFSNLEPGAYNIEFRKTSYYIKTITKDIVPNEVIDLGTITLNPKPGKIVGSTNADTVKIKETGQTVTVTNGSFTLDKVKPGSYTLRFTKTNYYPKEISVTVNPNTVIDVGTTNLNPMAGTIQGYLNNSADVVLVQENKVKYSQSGYFSFNNLLPGDYIVKVAKSNYYPKAFNITVQPEGTIDLGSININQVLPGALVSPRYEYITDSLYVGTSQSNTKSFNAQSTIISYSMKARADWSGSPSNTSHSYARILDNSNNELVELAASGDDIEHTKSGTLNITPGTFIMECIGGWNADNPTYAEVDVDYYNDYAPPKINTNKTWANSAVSHTISITFDDVNTQESGFNKAKYKITNSIQEPSFYDNYDGSDITLNNPGTWYIHIKAYDNVGNQSYKVIGPFIVN